MYATRSESQSKLRTRTLVEHKQAVRSVRWSRTKLLSSESRVDCTGGPSAFLEVRLNGFAMAGSFMLSYIVGLTLGMISGRVNS